MQPYGSAENKIMLTLVIVAVANPMAKYLFTPTLALMSTIFVVGL